MACALDDIASMLEAELAQGTPLNAAIQSLLAKLFAEHMPIVFDGNGYSDEWLAEAEKRGCEPQGHRGRPCPLQRQGCDGCF